MSSLLARSGLFRFVPAIVVIVVGIAARAHGAQSEVLAQLVNARPAFSGKGLMAISSMNMRAAGRCEISLWNLANGKRAATTPLQRDETIIYSLAFSHDGTLLAATNDVGIVRLYDAATGRLVRTLGKAMSQSPPGIVFDITPGRWVDSLAFTPDGKYLLANVTVAVTVFDLTSAATRQVGPGPAKLPGNIHAGTGFGSLHVWPGQLGISRIACSPDSKTMIYAMTDGTLHEADIQTGKLQRTIGKPLPAATSLAQDLLPEHKLAAVSDRGEVRIVNLENGQELALIRGGQATVTSVAFSPDGEALAIGDEAGAIRVLAIPSGRSLGTLNIGPKVKPQRPLDSTSPLYVDDVAFTPDGKKLVYRSGYSTLGAWENPAQKRGGEKRAKKDKPAPREQEP
ncbi:MAG: hypothetical protein K8T25_04440 [Planctomycetia bacterium]|nr:hypothetical protein [Planctomycetia bacterium]